MYDNCKTQNNSFVLTGTLKCMSPNSFTLCRFRYLFSLSLSLSICTTTDEEARATKYIYKLCFITTVCVRVEN